MANSQRTIAFAAFTFEDLYTVWVKLTPEYLAGVIAGFGLAFFCVFVFALMGDLTIAGLYRPAIGLLGIALLMAGGVWKLRIQSRPLE